MYITKKIFKIQYNINKKIKNIIFLNLFILPLLCQSDIVIIKKHYNYIIPYNKMKNIIIDVFLMKIEDNNNNMNTIMIKYKINKNQLLYNYKYYFINTDIYFKIMEEILRM